MRTAGGGARRASSRARSRSSPAARPGSASRSPRRIGATRRDGRDLQPQPASARAAAVERCAARGVHARTPFACDVSDRRRSRPPSRQALERTGARGRAGQQRRRHARRRCSMRMTDEQWDDVLDTNLRGAFRCCRGGGAHDDEGALRADRQRVVGGGPDGQRRAGQLRGRRRRGLLGLTKSLARELRGRSITVNAVCPGYIETEMTAALARGGAHGPPRPDPARTPRARRKKWRR